MSSEEKPIIIIKKISRKKDGHHGGAWKIAYADFVTAMMAFFMLLWLLSLLNKYQLQGISAYFKRPLSDVFSGSKNAEEYKNQIKTKVYEIKKNYNGNPNSDVQDKKSIEKENPSNEQSQGKSNKIQAEKQESPDSDSKKGKEDSQNDVGEELKNLKRNLEISLENNSSVKGFKDNISFSIVHDGVKVSLHDSENNPMFSLGKSDFRNYAKDVIKWLGTEFNTLPKKIIIIGHTDSNEYNEKANYTNWELSTDRANTVRHLLVLNGMKADKIIRVEGAAATSLMDKRYGDNPINRRVEIIVLTDEASQRLINQ